ncbi:hypothetical protein PHSC3_000762 [Chlamydiales bacterium STE3]|nr:hypothetical protein PHSC3_000762 [Chlamydiales bacterium STE3]
MCYLVKEISFVVVVLERKLNASFLFPKNPDLVKAKKRGSQFLNCLKMCQFIQRAIAIVSMT